MADDIRVAPSSEPSIPADLKEEYGQCFDYDRHTLIDKPFVRGLIERIGRAEDALDQIEKFAIYGCGTKGKDARGRQFSAILDICRAALVAPSGIKE